MTSPHAPRLPPSSAVLRLARKHSRRGVAKNARLVILNDDGLSYSSATAKDLAEYLGSGGRTVRGERDHVIGIRFIDDNENDVAFGLTTAEVVKLLG